MNTPTQTNQISFHRINNDINGNPRFVCHFLNFIHDSEQIEFKFKYDIALSRSRKLGGRKFHNKQYGGGIVFQMYDGEQEKMSELINAIADQYKTL